MISSAMGKVLRAVLAAGAGALALSAGQAAAARDVVIHAGRLIDGVSAQPREKVSILVRDDRIVSVEPGFTAPAGAEIVDLSNATVLPGLIDCHDHITASFHKGDPIRNAVTRTAYDDEIDAVNNARAELLAGFTTIRDVGANTEVVVALKKAVNAGAIPGPRMWVSGAPLGPTGGHGDSANGLDPELEHPGWTSNLIDSPEAARRAVRTLRREGADLIKIMPSGGVMSIGDDPKLQLMQDDEVKAVIETAHALGMKVAAHAHGKPAIDHAIALGVDSIEHGSYADAESYKLSRAQDNDAGAPQLRYFVIHDTSTPYLEDKPFPRPLDGDPTVNDVSKYLGANAVAHAFIDRRGAILWGHDFSAPWRATKLESRIVGVPAKGLFIHIENVEPRRRDPKGPPGNDWIAPRPGLTANQYDRLALLYLYASRRAGIWLIPAFHATVDEGIPAAHDDPQNFDLNAFARALRDRIQAIKALDRRGAIAPGSEP